jgi:ADP-dependent NAD(P)H-hydrate dehydratase / NAD(P)H-hydrate epimerase
MDRTFWHKQTSDKPLFEDLLWSRPEHKASSGKLLVVGGNLHGLSAPAEAYSEALKANVGSSRVLLPDATKKTVGALLENVDFGPSTPSGSFNRQSLGIMLDHANWANGVLFAGDFGRNSETAIALESFAEKYQGQLTITRDGVDYFTPKPDSILERSNTTFVLSLSQLQKLVQNAHQSEAVTFSMDLLHLVDLLHNFTEKYRINIVVKHLKTIMVASHGQVSTMTLDTDKEIWRLTTAAHVSVWWLQNPTKAFEALTTAVLEVNKKV